MHNIIYYEFFNKLLKNNLYYVMPIVMLLVIVPVSVMGAPACPIPFDSFVDGNMADFSYTLLETPDENILLFLDTDSVDLVGPGCGEYESNAGGYDIAILKLDPTLTNIINATYFGGTDDDEWPHAAFDSQGNLFVAARTYSSSIPALAGGGQIVQAGDADGMMIKYDSDLNVIQSTFVGGSGFDFPFSIVIDSEDSVFVAGRTKSLDFPNVTNGAHSTPIGTKFESFITKFDNDLSSSFNSTYFINNEPKFSYGVGLAIDSNDFIFMTGHTNNTALANVTGGIKTSIGDETDGFVVKFSNDLTTIVQSTYIGGSACDQLRGIGIDEFDNVYVTGPTSSFDFPKVTGGVQPEKKSPTIDDTDCENVNHSADVYVSILNNDLTEMIQSTYLGGSLQDNIAYGAVITFDSSRNVYIGGVTKSIDFPVTENAFQSSYNGGSKDMFVTILTSDLSEIVYSSYLGTEESDPTMGYALPTDDYLYVAWDANGDSLNGTSAVSNGSEHNVILLRLDLTEILSEFLSSLKNSSSDCGDCVPPTLGLNLNNQRMVEDGFTYNGQKVNVDFYHTEFPLITVITNETNNVIVKVYENQGPNNIAIVQFGLGMPEVGDSMEKAQTLVEVWLDSGDIEKIHNIDKNNLVEIVNATTSKVKCMFNSSQDCLQLSLDYIYLDQPKYNIMAVNTFDLNRNTWTHYFNDGVLVTGNSLNEPPSQKATVSYAGAFYPQKTGETTLTLTDYKTDVWTDEYGYIWSTNQYGPYLVDVISPPEIIPDEKSPWTGYNDRGNSEFGEYVKIQQEKAAIVVAEMNKQERNGKMNIFTIPESEIVFDRFSRSDVNLSQSLIEEAQRILVEYEKQNNPPVYEKYEKHIIAQTIKEILDIERAEDYVNAIKPKVSVDIKMLNNVLTISGNIGYADTNKPVILKSLDDEMLLKKSIPVDRHGNFNMGFLKNDDTNFILSHDGVILKEFEYGSLQ